MPVIEPSRSTAPVFTPKSDYKIVKYLDLTKYVSLLQKKALFFCRLDKLEDKFEGTTSKPNRELRIKRLQHLRNSRYFNVEMTDDDIIKSVNEQYEFEKNIKGITCINCWNKKTNESTALWKIYSSFTNGIMLKSTVNKLKKSLEKTAEDIQLSEVVYLDYSKDYMPDGNSNYPIIHKHIAYSYEEELRLIHTKMPEHGWIYDWSKEVVHEGIHIKADLIDLIDEIVISPYASGWFLTLVKDISEKYGLDKPIIMSELSNE